MGGSGGGGGGYLPRNLSDAVRSRMQRDAQAQAEQDRREAETNRELLSLLTLFNDRDVEGIQERLASVEDCLGPDIDFESILFGGSVAKHTYVDGLSDVDALVVVDGAQDWHPDDLKRRLTDLLRDRLPMGDVEAIREGDLAVTIEYRDGTELQLLPARRDGADVEISKGDGTGWSSIRPRDFTTTLTRVNQSQGGAVVPAIKLAKSLIAGLPENARLSGYHVEALAVEAFRDYEGRRTPVAMLRAFFAFASERVRRPVADITGQSRAVDEYLGEAGSVERRMVSDRLATVSRQLHAAVDPARWTELVAGSE